VDEHWRLAEGASLTPERLAAVLERTSLTVDELLLFLAAARSNLNHAVLAAMADRQLARIVTTNFDELIESAGPELDRSSRVYKPHGTMSAPQTTDRITTSKVPRGCQVRPPRRSGCLAG
jgi:NAD-dependent SIR2 family protein deacetylase